MNRYPEDEQLLGMFKTMLTIREFEEAAGRMAEQAKIPGAVHLYAGQEAVATGILTQLGTADTIASNHRGHGHCIAKGGDVKAMFAELLGRATGYCHGKGGSMHIADLDLGILGANGIVGGGPPIAIGAAFAAQYRGTDEVCICFSGDGSTNEGTWHEAVNFAALLKLPVIFVVENNHYAEFTRQDGQAAITRLSDRAAAYGILGVTVDGQDLLAVYDAAAEAIERARAGKGPTLLECDTYRYYNHTGRSEGDPRPEKEREEWRKRDPITLLEEKLLRQSILSPERAEEMRASVKAEIEAAIVYAEASPYPDPSELLTDIYS